MSSISIEEANKHYRGSTEQETVQKMAEQGGYERIYKYANDYGDHSTHTDYKQLRSASEEEQFLRSPKVHNPVLVYDSKQSK
jgi:hypothetical protein